MGTCAFAVRCVCPPQLTLSPAFKVTACPLGLLLSSGPGAVAQLPTWLGTPARCTGSASAGVPHNLQPLGPGQVPWA